MKLKCESEIMKAETDLKIHANANMIKQCTPNKTLSFHW